MIAVSLQQLADLLGAELINKVDQEKGGVQTMISEVTTDTRALTPGCLFVALKGERFDAHDFVEQAVNGGAGAVLVSKRLPLPVIQLLVKDTRIALGQLGAWVRSQVSTRVVALTGSSGKTSVKEMAASILQHCGSVLYTAGNLNNDIGVPLTLLRLTPAHQFAVIELGANHQQEIAYTVALTNPEAVLVNNIAAAHLEGFGSLAGVGRAKGEIFDGLPAGAIAIINNQSNDYAQWQNQLADKQVWRFSTLANDGADFYASAAELTADKTVFTLHTPFGSCTIELSLIGSHNIANALAATALAMSVGASLTAVRLGLAQCKAVKGRLYPIQISANKLLLDDTYNANVGSMIAAANVLATMPGYRLMVVGDMGELGAEAELCHRQVGDAIRNAGVDRVLSVGRLSRFISDASGRGEHFSDKAALILALNTLLKEHEVITILIKGSRSAAMEQIVCEIKRMQQC